MLGKQTQALSMPDKHSTNLDVVPALGDIKMWRLVLVYLGEPSVNNGLLQ